MRNNYTTGPLRGPHMDDCPGVADMTGSDPTIQRYVQIEEDELQRLRRQEARLLDLINDMCRWLIVTAHEPWTYQTDMHHNRTDLVRADALLAYEAKVHQALVLGGAA